MSASDYNITFPYGATSAPYSPTLPHRGDDRPCPTGTPIVIAGQTIGLTGATGNVIGAHLHIQEWAGDYANTRKPQNAFKSGVVINVDLNGTQGDGSFGKFITIKTDDGWNDSYCHLSKINVAVGQTIGEVMGIPDNDAFYGRFNKLTKQIRGREMSREEFTKNIVPARDPFNGVEVLSDSSEADQATADGDLGRVAREQNWQGQIQDLGKAIGVKDGVIADQQKEIESLKAQTGDNSKWETLKALVRELVGR